MPAAPGRISARRLGHAHLSTTTAIYDNAIGAEKKGYRAAGVGMEPPLHRMTSRREAKG